MSGSLFGGVPVFISWSGERSKAAAEALKVALPRCIQTVRPWMSDTAIRAGTRWFEEIGTALEGTKYCIAVLTADNLDSKWVHFEAGAISKTIGDSFVTPYLVGIGPEHVQGPLQQFNGVAADKAGTWKLVTGLHSAMGAEAPDLEVVEDAFESAWPRLDDALAGLPDATSGPPPPPDEPELLGRIEGRLSAIERSLDQLADRRPRALQATVPMAVEMESTGLDALGMSATARDMLEAWQAGLGPQTVAVGDLVDHWKWGLGWVTDLRGSGEKSEITIEFGTVGTKHLLTLWAPLRRLVPPPPRAANSTDG